MVKYILKYILYLIQLPIYITNVLCFYNIISWNNIGFELRGPQRPYRI